MNVVAHPPSPPVAAALAVAHKFGGSSLADAGRMRHVARLLRARNDSEQVVVVSAMQGVTDTLIALAHAAAGKSDWRPQWVKVRDCHLVAALELLGTHAQPTLDWLQAQFDELA